MKTFTPPSDRRACQALGGNMSQFAGVRRVILENGRARGVEALDFDNGSGFRFTVLPGRGMDISAASYRGVPLCFVAKPGVVAASEYDAQGLGWLRGFFAGLLTTCGLSNVGDPCDEDDPQLGRVHLGLHGRISNTVAENVSDSSCWEDDHTFVLRAAGRMREAVLHAEALTLTRRVTCVMGENHLTIEDTVENEGFESRPLTLLYHINAGHPLLSPDSALLLPIEAEDGDWNAFSAPSPNAPQIMYDHAPRTDKNGNTAVALVNRALELGLYVRFNRNELPVFSEWKRLSCGDYVLGMEPANVPPIGRAAARERGILHFIEPGEKKNIRLEIGVLDGADAIEAFRAETRALAR